MCSLTLLSWIHWAQRSNTINTLSFITIQCNFSAVKISQLNLFVWDQTRMKYNGSMFEWLPRQGFLPPPKKKKKSWMSAEQLQSHCQKHKHFTSQDLLTLVLMMSFLSCTTAIQYIKWDVYGFMYWKKVGQACNCFYNSLISTMAVYFLLLRCQPCSKKWLKGQWLCQTEHILEDVGQIEKQNDTMRIFS